MIKQPKLSNWTTILCLGFPFQNHQILTIGCQANRTATVHHLTHNVICLYQESNIGMINFICLCFLLSKNNLGKSARPQLLPHGVIHTLMNDLKDVYEEWLCIFPGMLRMVWSNPSHCQGQLQACQQQPLQELFHVRVDYLFLFFFFFSCCNTSGNLSSGLNTEGRRKRKFSPF